MKISQLAWKKLAEKPSEPGTLSGWIASRAKCISSGLGVAVSERFVYSDILDVRASVNIWSLSAGYWLK